MSKWSLFLVNSLFKLGLFWNMRKMLRTKIKRFKRQWSFWNMSEKWGLIGLNNWIEKKARPKRLWFETLQQQRNQLTFLKIFFSEKNSILTNMLPIHSKSTCLMSAKNVKIKLRKILDKRMQNETKSKIVDATSKPIVTSQTCYIIKLLKITPSLLFSLG